MRQLFPETFLRAAWVPTWTWNPCSLMKMTTGGHEAEAVVPMDPSMEQKTSPKTSGAWGLSWSEGCLSKAFLSSILGRTSMHQSIFPCKEEPHIIGWHYMPGSFTNLFLTALCGYCNFHSPAEKLRLWGAKCLTQAGRGWPGIHTSVDWLRIWTCGLHQSTAPRRCWVFS